MLLIWQGKGHTAYPKTDCITAAVDAYLIDLTAALRRADLPCVIARQRVLR